MDAGREFKVIRVDHALDVPVTSPDGQLLEAIRRLACSPRLCERCLEAAAELHREQRDIKRRAAFERLGDKPGGVVFVGQSLQPDEHGRLAVRAGELVRDVVARSPGRGCGDQKSDGEDEHGR